MTEHAEAVDEVGLRHDAQVVEAGDALGRHAVIGAEEHLGWDPADRPRDRGRKDGGQHRNGRRPREDEERTTTNLLELAPPDLAALYQGSAAMASRSEASAAACSPAVCGVLR